MTVDLLVLAYFAALVIALFYALARASLLWKPTVVVLVLSLCGLMLWYPGRYGPEQRLKPGLDLAGGTTLIYDVRVPEEGDTEAIIDDLINVLRDRVDPTGTRNLVWRQVAGNRIEIQMALATADTAKRRQAYVDARDALLSGNFSAGQLNSALALPAEQQVAALDQLAAGNAALREQLTQLAQANAELQAATQPYQQTQAQYDEIESKLAALGEDAEASVKEALQAQLETLTGDLQAKARVYLDARRAFQNIQQQVLEANIEPTELERALDQSAAEPMPGEASPRSVAIEELQAKYPGRAEQISQVAEAYAAYEKVKGPLDDPNDLIALLRGSGVLEFRIAAVPGDPAVDEAAYREQLEQRGPRAGIDKPYRWFAYDDPTSLVDAPDAKALLEESADVLFRQRGLIGQKYGDDYYVLLANTPDRSITRNDKNWELTSVRRGMDSLGQNALDFALNSVGGDMMARITKPSVGKPMAILLDNKVISAPNLNSQIADRGQITGGQGGFDEQELSYLLRTLKAGSTEAELGDYPISIKTTGPQLGQDNLRAGLEAAILSLVIVAAFMLVYYFFAGAIADFALAANMVVILGVMSLIEATWTLPGIAGIVLTIGMAVDANVLIFERIREELERDIDLATAVRLGYDKALSTILDANITTMITCVVLGYTATAEVKGFAVTLGIGILATLFTALFCTRVIMELYLKYVGGKSLKMLPTVVPGIRSLLSPNVDWIGKRYMFLMISAVLMVAGVLMVASRGQDMLDIEFRSGTQVSFDLAEGKTLPIAEVRDRLETYAKVGDAMAKPGFDASQLDAGERAIYETLSPILADAAQRREQAEAEGQTVDQPVDLGLLAEASVVTVGQAEKGEAAGFTIATLITDAPTVSAVVKAAFADVLDTARPIAFADETAPIEQAPVYALTSSELGEAIRRPDVVGHDVSQYLGGVAVVLEDMNPAPTIAELEQRVSRMRLQPAYEGLGFRQSQVIGLQMAEATEDGQPRYSSAVVVSRDSETNYIDNPQTFTDAAGLAATEWNLVHDALRRDTSLASVSNFSSQVSATMKQQAIAALVLSLLAVVVYIWFRFGSFRYGLAAIMALVHDVTIAMGLVAISGFLYDNGIGHFLLLEPFKINLALVAAVLTIVGYSLNDTIIVFDRIRENRGRLARATPAIINDSINQTISRTIITSGTTLLAVLILYIFGGAGVHGFAFAMLVGVLIGTYSSIAVAAPLLMLGGKFAAAGSEKKETTPATAN